MVIFVGLVLGILMAALDQTIVATAMPTMAGDLNGFEEISWIITAYLLAQTVAMPLYGRLGDFIGRRNAFHLAILIFLVGSVVAGLAQSMGMLIAFRAVQGVGAAGLMTGAQTIMAEIVSARERGKYMSVMGPMIGVATVVGPLLGGYLTQYISWRWIFYINIPIGIAAFVVTALVLKLPRPTVRPRVDYAGAVFLSAAVACLVLLLNWGGSRYDWTSITIIGLAIGVVVFVPLWALAERRAEQPVLPIHLFRDEVFRINVPLAFMVGIAMFGAVSFLPTFLQLAQGVSATRSGLLMLPLMGGMMAAAVMTGQLISRTGRYKVFPIIGTAIAAVGMYLLSFLDADTSRPESSLYMAVLGLGIGFVMPTLVLTVQNSVQPKDMGSATAGVNFFRQIGASMGVALIGSLFTTRLTDELAQNLPARAAANAGQHASGLSPEALAKLPPQIAHGVIESYANALTPLYAYLAPLLGVAFVAAWFLKEKPLANVTGGPGASERGSASAATPPAAPSIQSAPTEQPPPALVAALTEVLDRLDGLAADNGRAYAAANGHASAVASMDGDADPPGYVDLLADGFVAGCASADPDAARAVTGLTAAVLATRIITAPEQHPALLAAAARLVPAGNGDTTIDGVDGRDTWARAQQAAHQVLLPQAKQLLTPIAEGTDRARRAPTADHGDGSR